MLDCVKLLKLAQRLETMDPRLWDSSVFVSNYIVDLGWSGCVAMRLMDVDPDNCTLDYNEQYYIDGFLCNPGGLKEHLGLNNREMDLIFDPMGRRPERSHLEAALDIRSVLNGKINE